MNTSDSRVIHRQAYARLFPHGIVKFLNNVTFEFLMGDPPVYTPLEKHRTYLIGSRTDAKLVRYEGREFQDDAPPLFLFITDEGVVVDFYLHQLTALEREGALAPRDVAPVWPPPSPED